jgi:hypothetical protein
MAVSWGSLPWTIMGAGPRWVSSSPLAPVTVINLAPLRRLALPGDAVGDEIVSGGRGAAPWPEQHLPRLSPGMRTLLDCAGVRGGRLSGGFDFDSWVVGPPHRFVDLLDRVVDGYLCESFLDGCDRDGDGDGGGDGSEVVHRW